MYTAINIIILWGSFASSTGHREHSMKEILWKIWITQSTLAKESLAEAIEEMDLAFIVKI